MAELVLNLATAQRRVDLPYREIPLSQGLVALVDKQDYSWLSRFNWHARKDHLTHYAVRRSGYGFVTMHYVLAKKIGLVEEGKQIDHIDRNGLNNCRNNLRLATPAQNCANRRPGRGFSIEYGRNKPYKVQVGGTYIGRFHTEEEAVEAYNTARKERYGDFA